VDWIDLGRIEQVAGAVSTVVKLMVPSTCGNVMTSLGILDAEGGLCLV
jgi:hypothetical protein